MSVLLSSALKISDFPTADLALRLQVVFEDPGFSPGNDVLQQRWIAFEKQEDFLTRLHASLLLVFGSAPIEPSLRRPLSSSIL